VNLFLRRGLLALAVACLPACNSMTATSIETLKLAVSGTANDVSREHIRSVQADSLLVRANGAEGLFVAPDSDGEQVNWYGLSEQVQTDHGRVTQLLGVGSDVLIPLVANDPFITGLMQVSDGTTTVRRVDYPLAYQTGLAQHATYQRGPVERIDILGTLHNLQRIDETISMPQLNYRTTNYYWLDIPTGRVRRSVQHLSPSLPAVDVTVTRMPTSGATP
jgi:hypothetical protein